MTPQEINAAMAELDGWKLEDFPVGACWYNPDSPLCEDGQCVSEEDRPDYTTSLDAVAGVRIKLSEPQFECYLGELKNAVAPKEFSVLSALLSANALEHCTAILKACGKYKETTP